MCTVVTHRGPARAGPDGSPPGGGLQILAIRDEFTSRGFDDPDRWWPNQPSVVGGRDQVAGGSWCVSDVSSGVTALVLNRTERHTGTPSRGVLPLAGAKHGQRWTEHVDHRDMASFTLVLASAESVTAWTWDATDLVRAELADGLHVITSSGVDVRDDAKTVQLTPRFATQPWLDVVTAAPPRDDRTELIVRHEFETDTYATVFGQLITAEPGRLQVAYSRTPWIADGWTRRVFT